MKWYIASRQKYKEDVQNIINFLKRTGQKISYDWTKIPNLNPYSQNKKSSSKIAKEIATAIKKSDIFVLLSDKSGTDMYIELGIALNNLQEFNKPRTYIVGEDNSRSLMHFHPLIKRVNNIKKIYSLENII